ncbi:hypothetical protein ACWOAH_01510 [Vagococcus vulneris]|uniref:DUF4065 domain-containing protein n=1 Tax=Vagococcus vulneris TaxID=1977869 RepID=A0A430A1X4_9ENTE|nr:hypothetical protein [Vagococcus vulneris]RSU00438.1 hypothetical protein CBF37_00030 [Vagococcus vulneris]
MLNIIYPPIVEDTYRSLKTFDRDITIQQVYHILLKSKIIDECGQPTSYALNRGLVYEYTETADMMFEDFLKVYPVFNKLSAEKFKLIDGFWEMPVSEKVKLQTSIDNFQLTYDELAQLDAFFENR